MRKIVKITDKLNKYAQYSGHWWRCKWITSIILLLASTAWGFSDDQCIRCHGLQSTESNLRIDAEQYADSIHASEMGCTDCHTVPDGKEHFTRKDFKAVDCRQCHDQDNRHSGDGRVQCFECHSRHAVFSSDDPRSSLHGNNLKQTCGTCHPLQAQAAGLSGWITTAIASHPKQDPAGSYNMGMCVGCHQGQAAHGETEPVSDQNCHRCHGPLAKHAMLLGYMHTAGGGQARIVRGVAVGISFLGLVAALWLANVSLKKIGRNV